MSSFSAGIHISDELLADLLDDGNARKGWGLCLWSEGYAGLLERMTEESLERTGAKPCHVCQRMTWKKCSCGNPVCSDHQHGDFCGECRAEIEAEHYGEQMYGRRSY